MLVAMGANYELLNQIIYDEINPDEVFDNQYLADVKLDSPT